MVGFSSPIPMCSVVSIPISSFFGCTAELETGGEGSQALPQCWAGGLEMDNRLVSSFPWLSPAPWVGNTIPTDRSGEVWGEIIQFFVCVYVFGGCQSVYSLGQGEPQCLALQRELVHVCCIPVQTKQRTLPPPPLFFFCYLITTLKADFSLCTQLTSTLWFL